MFPTVYNTAVLAPMFIVFSFAYGLALFLLVLRVAMRWSGREFGDVVFERLRNLLGVFVASALYFVAVYHLTNLYITERHGIEAFILRDGGVYTKLFWLGQVIVGGILPLGILFSTRLGKSRTLVAVAAVLVVLGGLAQMYVTIIGGQAYPMQMFSDKDASSSVFDGVIASYTPSLPEIALGVGGMAMALGLTAFALKVLPFLPRSLADSDIESSTA